MASQFRLENLEFHILLESFRHSVSRNNDKPFMRRIINLNRLIEAI